MMGLDELVVALLETVPQATGGADEGVRVEVDEVEITFPVEVHFSSRRGLEASAPRGRYATGFDPPHQLLTLAFTTQRVE
jgi:hypothetical protein